MAQYILLRLGLVGAPMPDDNMRTNVRKPSTLRSWLRTMISFK